MTDDDYTIRGCTAILDAIGGAIHNIGNVHKYARARAEDVPEHTMFVITTDGMENASRHYDSKKIKKGWQEKMMRTITVKCIVNLSARPDYIAISITIESINKNYDKAMPNCKYTLRKHQRSARKL